MKALILILIPTTLGNASIEQINKQKLCLSTAIYYEARGETLKTQQLVQSVIINRAKNNNICAILEQPNQFPWYSQETKMKYEYLNIEQIETNYYHFNNKPFLWAKNPKKSGRLYFYEKQLPGKN